MQNSFWWWLKEQQHRVPEGSYRNGNFRDHQCLNAVMPASDGELKHGMSGANKGRGDFTGQSPWCDLGLQGFCSSCLASLCAPCVPNIVLQPLFAIILVDRFS